MFNLPGRSENTNPGERVELSSKVPRTESVKSTLRYRPKRRVRINLNGRIFALWKGTSPSVVRSLVMGTIQLSVYDELKTKLRLRGWEDDFKLFGLSGLIAGLACVIVGSPLDVVRSRRMVVRVGYTQARRSIHNPSAVQRRVPGERSAWVLPRLLDAAAQNVFLQRGSLLYSRNSQEGCAIKAMKSSYYSDYSLINDYGLGWCSQ